MVENRRLLVVTIDNTMLVSAKATTNSTAKVKFDVGRYRNTVRYAASMIISHRSRMSDLRCSDSGREWRMESAAGMTIGDSIFKGALREIHQLFPFDEPLGNPHGLPAREPLH